MNAITALRKDIRKAVDPQVRQRALRTAFVARFIVLREGRRSRAHRVIEGMVWEQDTTAQELYARFRDAFQKNGDRLQPVDRDLKRALEHAEKSVDYFIEQYTDRATLSFSEALQDYHRSNQLLFGDEEEVPRSGGWRYDSSTEPHDE